MKVLSKLPLSGPLAEMSQKKYDFLVFLSYRQKQDFFILVFNNLVILIPGIVKGVKLITIQQFKVKKKTFVNHSV